MNNAIRTFFLMAVLTVLFVLIGGYIGGQQGALIALVVAAGMNFYSFWFSDKMVLKKYRAQEVTDKSSRLYRIVSELAPRAGLPMPKVYIVPEQTPNAFATGRNPKNAAVAATEGIVNLLNDDELAGVMAHELAHVKNRDILTGTIAATLAGAIAMVAQFSKFGVGGGRRQNPIGMILIMVGAPLIAMLIRMGISRVREYSADKGGADYSGQPLALANALLKLKNGARTTPITRGNPAHSHLFIVNPFFGGGIQKLFATHPAVEERVKRLRSMAK